MMVALFWGANIGAVYPFVEVVFQGKTLHNWVDEQIETVQSEINPPAEAGVAPPVMSFSSSSSV